VAPPGPCAGHRLDHRGTPSQDVGKCHLARDTLEDEIVSGSSSDHLEDEDGRQTGTVGDAARVAALASLFDGEGPAELDEITGPLHWPDLSASELTYEWDSLRRWVEELMERFEHLDHHIIPRCWFRHNGHVEALAALRDQERVNYGETASGTAGVDWHRAFRDVEARLRDWTAQLACGARHESRSRHGRFIDPDEWEQFLTGRKHAADD
jgi:hypothetical protein